MESRRSIHQSMMTNLRNESLVIVVVQVVQAANHHNHRSATRNITTARKVTAEIIIVIGMVVGIGMDIHIIIQADIIMEIIHIDREIVIEMIQDGAKRDLELNHPLL